MNRRARLVACALLLVTAAAIPACKKKRADQSSPTPAPGSAAAGSSVPVAIAADLVIKQGRARIPDMTPTQVVAAYVRSDGTLDPRYGDLELDLVGPEPGPPPDDPKRPTGAPVPPPTARRACVNASWTLADGWRGFDSTMPGMCMFSGTLPVMHCTVAAIWQRALADGAPKDALAKISFGGMVQPGHEWGFSITDEPRDVHFSRDYADDCPAVVEATPR